LGILVFLAVFIQFDIYIWAAIVGLIIMGGYLLVKGYGLDRKLSTLFSRPYHYTLSGLVTNFSMIAGILLVVVGLYQAWSYISATFSINLEFPVDVGRLMEILPQGIGWFIYKSLTMIIIGLCVSLAGRSVGYVLDRDSRFWRTAALVIICAWSWTIFTEISLIIINPAQPPDALIISTIIGIVVIVASGLSTHLLSKQFQHIFKDRQEEREEVKEVVTKAEDS
jgi:uncharacterized membrane protein